MGFDILIVDDNRSFLTNLIEGLIHLDHELTISSAFNGKEAIKTLTSVNVDLVVTDLKMPVMDGFELLTYMSQHFPKIPVIIMTAFGTPEIEKTIRKKGAASYLEKPSDFKTILLKIYESLEAKAGGYISEIFLPSFLQLLEMEKKSCHLSIHSLGRMGNLFFDEGQLVHASFNDIEGTAAALEIIGWDETVIEMKAKFNIPARTIDEELSYLLLESLRQKDEREKAAVAPLLADGEGIAGFDQRMAEAIKDETRPLMEVFPPEHLEELKKALDSLKGTMGEGLVASDIFSTRSGLSVTGYSSQPLACALFNRITQYLTQTLDESGFPPLGRLYTIELVEEKLVCVLIIGKYQWIVLVDASKSPLGLLLNVAIPNALKYIEKAAVQ